MARQLREFWLPEIVFPDLGIPYADGASSHLESLLQGYVCSM
jgi:hypothetical protein